MLRLCAAAVCAVEAVWVRSLVVGPVLPLSWSLSPLNMLSPRWCRGADPWSRFALPASLALLSVLWFGRYVVEPFGVVLSVLLFAREAGCLLPGCGRLPFASFV